MHALKRRLTTTVLVALGALLVIPAAGQAATTFGSRLKNEPNTGNCAAPCTVVSYINPIDPNGDPYSGGAPSNGVVTKFKIWAKAEKATPVTLRVANLTRDANDAAKATAAATGTGPTVTIPATSGGDPAPILEFPSRFSIKKGQHLAVDGGPTVDVAYDSSGSKFSFEFSPPLLNGAAPQASTEATGELQVQATLEPDADNDGFGDETQDQCPSQASTQGPCDKTAPTVGQLKVQAGVASFKLSEAAALQLSLVRKLPGRKVGGKCVRQTKGNIGHKRCQLFRPVGKPFAATGKAGANSVALPHGSRLAPGNYRLDVTATDTAGNKSTQRTFFRVKPKPKKKA